MGRKNIPKQREIKLKDIDIASIIAIVAGAGFVGGAVLGYRKGMLDEEHATAAATLGAVTLFATFLINVEYTKRPQVIEVPYQFLDEQEVVLEAEEPETNKNSTFSEDQIERIKEKHPWFDK